jgi:hypothetical protein
VPTKTKTPTDWLSEAPSTRARRARDGVVRAAAAAAGLSEEAALELMPAALDICKSVSPSERRHLLLLSATLRLAIAQRGVSSAAAPVAHDLAVALREVSEEITTPRVETDTPLFRLAAHLTANPVKDTIHAAD